MAGEKTKEPTRRAVFTLRESDHALLEPLRKRYAERSHAGVIRRLLREAAKREGVKP